MIDRNDTSPTTANGHSSLKDRVRELRLDDRLSAAKEGGHSLAWLPWALCFVMAVAWTGVGIRWYRAQSKPMADAPAEGNAQPAPKLNAAAEAPANADPAAEVVPNTGELVLEKKGYIIPAHQIPISPIDVAGRIIELNFMEGDVKKKGDILARIDPTSYDADLREAEAQVMSADAHFQELVVGWDQEKLQAESDLGEARAQLAEALLVYETSRNTSGGAVAKLELNQNKKKHEALVQRVKSLEAKLVIVQGPRKRKNDAADGELKAANARLKRARWRLDNCAIKAPVTGVVLTKKAENGSLINPVVGGVSTSLCEMADLSDLEVDLEVDERDIAKVFNGQECTVRVDAYPNRSYHAYVSRIMPIGNRGKAVLPIRVKVIIPMGEVQGRYLKPEMNALVSFYNKQAKEYDPSAHAPGVNAAPAETKNRP